MIIKIWWNADYETHEAIHSDGYIEPLRDSYDAEMLARKHGLLNREFVPSRYMKQLLEPMI